MGIDWLLAGSQLTSEAEVRIVRVPPATALAEEPDDERELAPQAARVSALRAAMPVPARNARREAAGVRWVSDMGRPSCASCDGGPGAGRRVRVLRRRRRTEWGGGVPAARPA